MADSSADDELTLLRTEVERLAALVGPDERSYEQLRVDAAGAVEAARRSEAELGQARGELVEMQTQLARARGDQDRLQRMLGARHTAGDRASGLIRTLRSKLAPFKRRFR